MAVTVVKSIGTTGRNFSTLQAWEDGAPSDLTTAEQWAANTFTGTFQQGETVTGTGLTAGTFLDTNGSSSITFGIVTGNTATLTTLTGSTSGATCIVSSKTTTGVVWQGQCYNDTAFSGATTLLTVAGSTSSSTAYKELTTATGQSFRDNASVQTNALRFNTSNGCSISLTGSYQAAIYCPENNFHISNLQVTGSTSNGSIGYAGDATGIRADSCLFGGASNNINNSAFGSAGLNGTFTNSVFESTLASGTNQNIIMARTATFVNCTLVVSSDKTTGTNGFFASYGTITIKNCAVFGVTNPLRVGTGSSYSTTTSYSNNSGTGFTVVAYDTSTGSGFQNITYATRDFRIKSGSAMLNVGTTDSTNAPIDIAGTARPQGAAYDIGCWELIVSAASVVARLFFIKQAINRSNTY